MHRSTPRNSKCGWTMRRGDRAAREDLLRHTCERLRRLALEDAQRLPAREGGRTPMTSCRIPRRRLLRGAEGSDARLHAGFRLAAAQIRRQSLDLARRCYGPRGSGANHASWRDGDGSQGRRSTPWTRANPALAELKEVHERVKSLPQEDATSSIGCITSAGRARMRPPT